MTSTPTLEPGQAERLFPHMYAAIVHWHGGAVEVVSSVTFEALSQYIQNRILASEEAFPRRVEIQTIQPDRPRNELVQLAMLGVEVRPFDPVAPGLVNVRFERSYIVPNREDIIDYAQEVIVDDITGIVRAQSSSLIVNMMRVEPAPFATEFDIEDGVKEYIASCDDEDWDEEESD